MGLLNQASSSSSSRAISPMGIKIAKIKLNDFSNNTMFEKALKNDFPKTSNTVLSLFQSFHDHPDDFENEAPTIGRFIPVLLQLYTQSLPAASCNWSFPPKDKVILKGEALWKTMDKMLKTGSLRKSMAGLINESYYAYIHDGDKLIDVEVMTLTSGFELKPEHENRVAFNENFYIAAQRFQDHQDFLLRFRELLIECLAEALLFVRKKNMYLNHFANVATLPLLVEIEKLVKLNEWNLAAQALSLVNSTNDIYFRFCTSTLGTPIIYEILTKAPEVLKEGDEAVSGYSELLSVVAKKLSALQKGLGAPETYQATVSLPKQFNEQATELVFSDLAYFTQIRHNLNLKFIHPQTLFFAKKYHLQTGISPEDSLLAFKYISKQFIIQFNSLQPKKKAELLRPHLTGKTSVLYSLLTGDFKGEYLKKAVNIHLQNRVREWQDSNLDLTGLPWDNEFDSALLADPQNPNVIDAVRLLIHLGLYESVIKLFKVITTEHQKIIFDAVHGDLLNNLLTECRVQPSIELFYILLELDEEKSLMILKEIEVDKVIALIDRHQVSCLVKLNTFYVQSNRETASWRSLMASLKNIILNLPIDSRAALLRKHPDDIPMLFLPEITIMSEKQCYMNSSSNQFALTGWFSLQIMSDAQIIKLAAVPGLTLSLILRVLYELNNKNPNLAICLEVTTRFCALTARESDLRLSAVEQQATKIFMQLLHELPENLLLELIRCSTADSLAWAIEGVLKSNHELFSDLKILPSVLQSLLEKLSLIPMHPCCERLKSDALFMRYHGHQIFASAPPSYDEAVLLQPLIIPPASLQSSHALPVDEVGVEQKLQQLFETQTQTLLRAIRGDDSERVKALEAENRVLQDKVASQKLFIASKIFPVKVGSDKVEGQVKRRFSFS